MRSLDNAMTDVLDEIQYPEELKYRVHQGEEDGVYVLRIYNKNKTKKLKLEVLENDGTPCALVMYRVGFTTGDMTLIMDTLMDKLSPDDDNEQ
jgi:hypothetical protein